MATRLGGYKATRLEAYEAIDTERAYQDAGRGNAVRLDGKTDALSEGEFVTLLHHLVAQATSAFYYPGTQDTLPHLMRKIAGVAVQFMERFGAPPR